MYQQADISSIISSIIIAFIAVSIVKAICKWLMPRHEEEETEELDITGNPMKTEDNTPASVNGENTDSRIDLLLDTLKQLNCEVTKVENRANRWAFQYQGIWYHVDAWDDNCCIVIWCFDWQRVKLDNLEQVCLVRRALNDVNVYIDEAAPIIYTLDEEDNTMNLHTKVVTVFGAMLDDTVSFMQMMLAKTFSAKSHFVYRFNQLLAESEKEG